MLTPLPLTLDVTPDGQRWQAYALADNQGEFAIPSGFFLGPGGPDGRGKIGPVARTFDSMVARAGQTGRVPPVTRATRVAALQDLEYWDVQVVVLADAPHGAKWPVRADARAAGRHRTARRADPRGRCLALDGTRRRLGRLTLSRRTAADPRVRTRLTA